MPQPAAAQAASAKAVPVNAATSSRQPISSSQASESSDWQTVKTSSSRSKGRVQHTGTGNGPAARATPAYASASPLDFQEPWRDEPELSGSSRDPTRHAGSIQQRQRQAVMPVVSEDEMPEDWEEAAVAADSADENIAEAAAAAGAADEGAAEAAPAVDDIQADASSLVTLKSIFPADIASADQPVSGTSAHSLEAEATTADADVQQVARESVSTASVVEVPSSNSVETADRNCESLPAEIISQAEAAAAAASTANGAEASTAAEHNGIDARAGMGEVAHSDCRHQAVSATADRAAAPDKQAETANAVADSSNSQDHKPDSATHRAATANVASSLLAAVSTEPQSGLRHIAAPGAIKTGLAAGTSHNTDIV